MKPKCRTQGKPFGDTAGEENGMAKLSEIIVKTNVGKVEGYEQRGLYVFKGIPFAAPPVGKRRWMPPAPVQPWSDIRPVKTSTPIAPQNIGPSVFVAADQPVEREPQSEDCLYLNVWTPGLDNAHRPVLFWIHGGGFTGGSGSSAAYKGSRLSARGDVVVVTTNYRLGALGFLNLNEVTAGRIPATGNEGLLDQAAALEWVHNNIASFGGDPGNVTIFGESAGGMSVGCQLALPRSKGLFRRAILQSGAANSTRTPQKAALVAEQLLDILNIKPTDIDTLFSLSVARLLAAQQELGPRLRKMGQLPDLALQPVIDGTVLPMFPIDAVRKGAAKTTPIIVGTNLDEWKIMNSRNPEIQKLDEASLLQRIRWILPSQNGSALADTYRKALARRGVLNQPCDIYTAIETDQKFRIPAIRLAEAQQSQGQSAYNYLFTWTSPVPGGALAAYHALELGFLFGNYGEGYGSSGPKADAVSRNIQDAWLAFARNDDPSCESIGKWPSYGERRSTMMIKDECHVEEAPYDEERRIWEHTPDEELG
jgi:para-nitrobenzyl esterase